MAARSNWRAKRDQRANDSHTSWVLSDRVIPGQRFFPRLGIKEVRRVEHPLRGHHFHPATPRVGKVDGGIGRSRRRRRSLCLTMRRMRRHPSLLSRLATDTDRDCLGRDLVVDILPRSTFLVAGLKKTVLEEVRFCWRGEEGPSRSSMAIGMRVQYLFRRRRSRRRDIIDAVPLTLAQFACLGGQPLSGGELECGRELPGQAVLLLMVQPLPLLPPVDLLDEAHLVRLRLQTAAREVQLVLEEGGGGRRARRSRDHRRRCWRPLRLVRQCVPAAGPLALGTLLGVRVCRLPHPLWRQRWRRGARAGRLRLLVPRAGALAPCVRHPRRIFVLPGAVAPGARTVVAPVRRLCPSVPRIARLRRTPLQQMLLGIPPLRESLGAVKFRPARRRRRRRALVARVAGVHSRRPDLLLARRPAAALVRTPLARRRRHRRPQRPVAVSATRSRVVPLAVPSPSSPANEGTSVMLPCGGGQSPT